MTIKHPLILLALAALAATQPPAQAAPEQPAPAAAAPASQLDQASQTLLALTRDVATILEADTPEAEKLAALDALKPRAAAFGKEFGHLRHKRIALATEALMTEEDKARFAAIHKNLNLQGGSELFKALEAIGKTIEENVPATPAAPTADTRPEDLAFSILATLSEGMALTQDRVLTNEQRVERLDELAARLERILDWAKQAGDTAAVAAQLREQGFDKDTLAEWNAPIEQWQEQSEDPDLAAAAYDYLSNVSLVTIVFHDILRASAAAHPEKLKEALAAFTEIVEATNAIGLSGKTSEEKIAALDALKPHAREAGALVRRVGFEKINDAFLRSMSDEEARERLAA